MSAAEIDVTVCAGCDAALNYLRQLPKVRAVFCDDCGAKVERPARTPRPESDGERDQREAREEQRTLSDMAAVARWRRHESERLTGVLGALQGRTVQTSAEDAASARAGAPPDDADREADLARARLLDGRLRALAATSPDAAAVLAWLVERGGETRHRERPASEKGNDTRAKVRPLCELVGVAFVDGETLARWVGLGSKADRRSKRARPADELAALREQRLKGDGQLAAAAHGRPLLRAAVQAWIAARRKPDGEHPPEKSVRQDD